MTCPQYSDEPADAGERGSGLLPVASLPVPAA